MGDIKVMQIILLERTEGKRPLRKPKHRWEDKIASGVQ
jgi:hypothetical protein